MEEQKVAEKTIPVFTVLKNGAILKNIFVVNSGDISAAPPGRNGNDDGEVEEILRVGRHPDCDILLTHPSISRFHLEIRSVPSRHRLFVTDLSSVHGTWVADQKVEPGACVEVKEGDVIRIGGSTRTYRLHWIPLSRAYDFDNPFVSPLDASTAMEQEEENAMLEIAHQSHMETASGDDRDPNLDVTSEGTGTGSSVPSENEDTYITTQDISLPLASPSIFSLATHPAKPEMLQFDEDMQASSKWDLDVIEAAEENASVSYCPSTQNTGGYPGVLGCSELEVDADADESDVRGIQALHLDVMSEGLDSLVSTEDDDTFYMKEDTSLSLISQSVLALARDSVKTQNLQFHEDLQTLSKWDLDVVDTATEKPSTSYSACKQQSGGYPEVVGCSELEVAGDADESDARQDGALNLDVMSTVSSENEDQYLEAEEASSTLLPRDSTETETLQLTEDVKATQELAIDIAEANAENPVSCCFPSKGQIVGCIEALGYSSFELAAEVEILSLHPEGNGGTDFVKKQVMEASTEPLTKDVIQSCRDNGKAEVSRQIIVVSPSSFPLTEPTLENITEDSQGLLGSEVQSEVALDFDIENVYQRSNGEIEVVPIQSHEDNGETEVSRQLIAESPNCFPQTEVTLENSTEDSQGHLGSEFQNGVALETDSKNLYQKSNGETEVVVIESHEDNEETEVARQIIAVSPNSFPQTEPTSENVTENSQGQFQSEVASETDSENLYQKNNGDTKVGSRQASTLSDCWFAGNESLSRINTEDIQSLLSSWQPLPKSESGDPSEISSELNPSDNENPKSGMSRETETIVDDGSSSCLSEDFKQSDTQSVLLTPIEKSKPETSTGSGVSEESYSLSKIEDDENAVKEIPFPSTLAAETFEDAKRIEELPSDYTGSQENQTLHADTVSDGVLSEINSSGISSRRISTSNIWSRRGKDAFVLQLRTNRSKGKQKQTGDHPKAQLQRKQVLRDNSISLTVHAGGENLEPEIFTPDKENLTPKSHMLRRLQDIGDIKDSKSSSKLSRSSCSSKIPSVIDIITSEALTEPEIFTPDKENLTPNSHMLKRMREVGDIKETKGSFSKATRKPFFDIHLEENVMAEQKPGQNSVNSKSKVKHEVVAPKNTVERTPFQPLLEESSAQSQSYPEASSTTLGKNNISRVIRFSSNLSDGKSQMKWTIVLDTSSLLDKESRKPLHLLQGLKGTHLVVPRTVLRELYEMKRTRSLLFNRKAEIASSALDWIEECKVNTKWWIQLQKLSEETKATAPTPPVTPQSNIGSAAFPFSLHWNNNAPEIDSPTSQDQVLECALLHRKINNDEKLVVLSNDATLKIKAMAEGVICETAYEFYDSLVNPFSERFMWRESSARGRTWSHVDDVVLRERYNNRRGVRGAAAKGLKLILHHNSQYGHNH